MAILFSLSLSLFPQYSHQLAVVGSSDRLLYKLLRQFLSPPHVPLSSSSPVPPPVPVTPTSRRVPLPTADENEDMAHPRINLRVFGSYYTISYMILCCLVIGVTGVPLLLVFLLLLLSLFMYSLIKHCLSRN